MKYGKIAMSILTIAVCVCLFFVATKLPIKVYLQSLEALERMSEDLYLPGFRLLKEAPLEKNFTDRMLELTFTPWYYEEAGAYIRRNVKTQGNEAYLECILENDSTDYYQLMQEENEKDNRKNDLENRKTEGTEYVGNHGVESIQNGENTGQSGTNGEENGEIVDQSGEGVEESADPVEQSGVKVEENGAISPKYQYSEEELDDYEELVKSFYVIDQNTQAGSDVLNANVFEDRDFTVEKNTEEPMIYIYHTHSKENFCNSREGVKEDTVVGAGAYLAELLRAYGYNVLHDEAVFDEESRDYAYSNALPHLESVLKENPSIQVVIDLHRDEMPEETHLVSEVGGKRCARYMFFNGMSWLKGKGEIDTLDNPNKSDNLSFSFQLQKTSNEYYPGLARRIYLKAYRYNLHLRPASVLIELGAQNNTVEEIKNGCEPLAFVLDQVLSGH